MHLHLKNRIAAVAGASRGIGAAVARALAEEGCKVAICSRNTSRIAETAKRIKADTGAEVWPIPADVGRKEDATRFVQMAAKQLGGLDILVTNAGGPPPGTLHDLPEEAWISAFHTTVLSVVRMTKAAIPYLRKSVSGRIVNLTSSSVRQPIENLMLSNSLRLSVIGFSKHLALELAKEKITVNCVCPGWTDTERVQELVTARADRDKTERGAALRAITGAIPAGRLATPEEIADLVLFLASDRSSYITGTAIGIDGGYVRTVF